MSKKAGFILCLTLTSLEMICVLATQSVVLLSEEPWEGQSQVGEGETSEKLERETGRAQGRRQVRWVREECGLFFQWLEAMIWFMWGFNFFIVKYYTNT